MIVCPYPFVVKGETILLARRKNTGYMPGMYSLPAGHEEENERLLDCMAREVAEETGITFASTDAALVHVMHRHEEDVRLDLFFLLKKWNGEPRIREPEKCDDMRFFPLNDLPEHTVPYIKAAILYWKSGMLYSEWGWK